MVAFLRALGAMPVELLIKNIIGFIKGIIDESKEEQNGQTQH